MLVKQSISAIWRGTFVAPIVGLSVPVLFTLGLHPQERVLRRATECLGTDALGMHADISVP